MSTTAGFIAGRMSAGAEADSLRRKLADAQTDADDAVTEVNNLEAQIAELNQAINIDRSCSVAARELIAKLCDLAVNEPEKAVRLLRDPSVLREFYDQRRSELQPFFERGEKPVSAIYTACSGLWANKLPK